jgi:hypothetical protein
MVTPAARREAIVHLRTSFEVSERRACKVLGADRTSVRYRGQRADDAIVRGRLRELAAIRRRFGYRRLLVLMRREGLVIFADRRRISAKPMSPPAASSLTDPFSVNVTALPTRLNRICPRDG